MQYRLFGTRWFAFAPYRMDPFGVLHAKPIAGMTGGEKNAYPFPRGTVKTILFGRLSNGKKKTTGEGVYFFFKNYRVVSTLYCTRGHEIDDRKGPFGIMT